MKPPDYKNASVPEAKIRDYLLSLSHRDGRGKAKFFRHFGFCQEDWQVLARALKLHISQNEITKTEKSCFGTRYVVEGPLSAPDGRHPQIRSVWFVKNDGGPPVFVTAYPLKGEAK
jgi:hypothetical protein